MNKVIIGLIIVGVLSSLLGCASDNGNAEGSYKNIKPAEAKELLNSEKSAVLLDVRTQQEYNEGHIPNSLLIPLDGLKESVESKIPDKEAKTLIYCRSGSRSKQAADILISKGYKNVYNLGGIIDWPYEIEK